MKLFSNGLKPSKFYGISQRQLPSTTNELELVTHIHDIIDNVLEVQRILTHVKETELRLPSSSPPLPSSPPPPYATPPLSTLAPPTPRTSRSQSCLEQYSIFPTLTPPTPKSSRNSISPPPSLTPPSPRSSNSSTSSSSSNSSFSSSSPPTLTPPSPQSSPRLTAPPSSPSPSMQVNFLQALPKVKAKEAPTRNFKIIKRIGYGSYGSVSAIENPNSKGIAALKTIDKFASNMRLDDVESEVEILKYLQAHSHPYFLEFLDFYESSTQFYIITEYLDGYIDLTCPTTTNTFTDSNKNQIISNMLLGLKKLHSLGVVHRDVKIENILIEPKTLNIKYIDFGLSRYGNSCVGFRRIGSQLFMAPELFYNFATPYQFSDYEKADVWALGLTIVELLTNVSYYDLFLSSIILPELKIKNTNLHDLVQHKKDYNTFTVIEIMNELLSSKDPFPLGVFNSIPKTQIPLLTRMLHKNPVFRSF